MRYVDTAKQTDSYWHATVYDAGYSESEIAEAMREVGIDGKDSTRFKREFMGEFIRDESAVIVPEFRADVHVRSVPRPVYYSELYKASGADLGVSDKTVALFAYCDFPKSCVVIQREFVLTGVDVRTDIFADHYRSAVRDLGWDINASRVQHWSDNSNLMLLNDLSQLHDIHINPTDKEQKAEWLNKVRILFGQGRILIDPSCKLLISTLHGAFWKDALKKDYGRSVALGHMDALDALIYLVRNIRTEVNPFPLNYDLSRGVIFDGKEFTYPPDWNTRPHTQEGRVLERVFGKSRFGMRPKDALPMGGL
jgi:hypothetical protein